MCSGGAAGRRGVNYPKSRMTAQATWRLRCDSVVAVLWLCCAHGLRVPVHTLSTLRAVRAVTVLRLFDDTMPLF